ncbi:MAG: hypothetical protein ABI972_06595 [Acidobacteriota bacterium]
MTADSEVHPASIWAVSALLAGVFLNAALLRYEGMHYPNAAHPWQLLLTTIVYSLFLCFGVCYFPLRLGNRSEGSFDNIIQSVFGTTPAWVFKRVVIPVWAATWFAFLTTLGTSALGWSLTHPFPVDPPGWPPHPLLVHGIWFLMIGPIADASLPRLANSSVFVVKVSFAAILGLLLSSARFAPATIARIQGLDEMPGLTFESHVLIWAIPPLFVCANLIRPYVAARRTARIILIVGIALPLLFVLLSAIYTMAGAAAIDGRWAKVPEYAEYAGARFHKIGWVKLLVLTFTLLTAARLAVNAAVRSLTNRKSLVVGAIVTALLMGASFWTQNSVWAQLAWQYAAVPFAPLAGVLCGNYAAFGAAMPTLSSRDRAVTILSWISGCLVTCGPAFMGESHHSMAVHSAWVLLGWMSSFTAACTYLSMKKISGHCES